MIGSADKTMDKHPDSLSRPSAVFAARLMRRPILSRPILFLVAVVLSASQAVPAAQATLAHNPPIWADVPDMSMMRVGKTYYMSSTTIWSTRMAIRPKKSRRFR
jgi:hypothetical protein